MWNAWLVGFLGLWMVIAPFAGNTTETNAWNNWIIGIVVAFVGFSMRGDRAWHSSLASLAGVWLFISGYLSALLMGSGLVANDIIVGLLLMIAGFGAVSQGHPIGTAPPRATK